MGVCNVKFSINPMNMARGIPEMFSTDQLNCYTTGEVSDDFSNEIKERFLRPVENMLHELDNLGLHSMKETNPQREFKFSRSALQFEQVKQSNTVAEYEFYFDFKKYINQK